MKYISFQLLSVCLLVACQAASPTGSAPQTPTPEVSPTILPAEDEPIMTATPSPLNVVPEATAAPPTGYFVKIVPTTVCIGDTLTFSAHLQRAGVKSLFLEKDLNREGKVPYFAGPYVLVQRFDTGENAPIHYSFTLTTPMKDADGEKTLAIQPGKYLMHLMYENTEITGVSYITVTECNR